MNKTNIDETTHMVSDCPSGIDLSVSAILGVTEEELEFILEHRHLDDEEFESLFEEKFGYNPNSLNS